MSVRGKDTKMSRNTKHYNKSRTHSRIWCSVAWLGSLGMLSSNVVFAQAQAPNPPAIEAAVPPDSTSAVETPSQLQPIEQPAYSEPVSAIVPPPAVAATNPSASPELDNHRGQTTLEVNGTYIDPTKYNLGATPYSAPDTIVLTDRTTGCQTTFSTGNSASRCETSAPQAISANQLRSLPRPQAIAVSTPTTPLQLGPVSISPTTPQTGNADPLTRAYYYNQTQRPQAVRGNNNTRLLFPLALPAPLTSPFGWRIHPITGEGRMHTGADLGAQTGTPVVASYTGRVLVSDFMGGYGLTVVVGHNTQLRPEQASQTADFTQETLYAHLSEVFVQPGEWVEQGQVIGRVGNTGLSTGPHLHFELRQLTNEGWIAVDPGQELEQAMALLVNGLQYADSRPQQPTVTGKVGPQGMDG